MAGATLPVQPANSADPQYVSTCNAFDEKLRRVYAQSDVVAGIVDANLAMTVCPILAKPWFNPQDRETLWNSLQTLWKDVPGYNW